MKGAEPIERNKLTQTETMKPKHLSIIALAMTAMAWTTAEAAVPSGYYKNAEGKNQAALLSALCGIVGSPNVVGYSNVWTQYKKTDLRSNGKIWDIYSSANYTYNSGQCGAYSKVGDCYNREHSMPQSFFNKQSPMVSDMHHVYPTDGKVNGWRSDYPYGVCANGTKLSSANGVTPYGKLGKSTYSGYSGTVYEPDDEYKGDLARTYFYMAAAYNNKIKNWSGDIFAGNAYPAYATWVVNMMLEWSRKDPISQKEKDRNEAVYAIQGNRNPFIDNPGLEEYIWGNKKTQNWSASGSSSSSGSSSDSGSSSGSGGSTPAPASSTNVEGFESITTGGTYWSGSTYTGDKYKWTFSNAGIFGPTSSDHFNGNKGVRFGTSVTSYIVMAASKTNGAGTISFYAAKFGTDIDATVQVQYSTDNGSSWTTLATASITATSLKKYSYTVNKTGNIRFKFAQKSGKRICLDDVTITDYTTGSSSSGSSSSTTTTTSKLETFEAITTASTYWSGTTKTGSAFSWFFSNAGIFATSSDRFRGTKGVRFGTSATSYIVMQNDKTNGLGTLTFYAANYGTDANATLKVMYSTNGGSSWTTAGSVTLTSSLKKYSATINKTGNIRIKFAQSAGKRLCLDDVQFTDYTSTKSADVDFEQELDDEWNTYSIVGGLKVNAAKAKEIAIYNASGNLVFKSKFPGETVQVNLPKGMYIVALDGNRIKKVAVR